MSFKSGDLVELKSGGPVMTVQSVDTDQRGVWAQWFSGKKLERGHFSMTSLKAAKSDDE